MTKRSDNTYPIDVFWIARYDYQPGWTLLSHTHPFYQIIYVLEGEAHLRSEEHTGTERTLSRNPLPDKNRSQRDKYLRSSTG